MSFADDPALDALLEPIDLSGEDPRWGPAAPLPPYRRPPSPLYRASVIGAAVLFLFSVVGLAVVSDSSSGRSTLSQIRDYVRANRTATFTGTTGSHTESVPRDPDDDFSHEQQTEGQVRLPNEGRVVSVDDDGYATETIVHVDTVFARDADSRADLAGERWTTSPGAGAVPAEMAELFAEMSGKGEDEVAGTLNDSDVAVMFRLAFAMDLGIPLHLDDLLGRLRGVRKTGPSQLTATMSLRQFFGDDFMELIDGMRVEAHASSDDDAPPDLDEDREPVVETGSARPLRGSIVVTLDYGGGGRLDGLHVVTTVDADDEITRDEQRFRFSDWGKPVSLTLPQAADVDNGDGEDSYARIDEDGLRAAQAKFRVLAPSPESLAGDWLLQSAHVNLPDPDDVPAGCEVVSLQFGKNVTTLNPGGDDGSSSGPGVSGASLPDMLGVRSTPASCAANAALDVTTVGSEPIRVGRWSGRITRSPISPGHPGLMSVLEVVLEDVDGTRVDVHSTLPEDQLLGLLRTLQVFDLNAYPRGDRPTFGRAPGGH